MTVFAGLGPYPCVDLVFGVIVCQPHYKAPESSFLNTEPRCETKNYIFLKVQLISSTCYPNFTTVMIIWWHSSNSNDDDEKKNI